MEYDDSGVVSAKPDIFKHGDKFHGYVVERLLGKGGLGAVYLVRHEMLDAYYALKVLYPAIANKNPVFVKRFVREGRIASRVRHRNLVAVHDIGHDVVRDVYYMVMDYVTGGNLRQSLAMGGAMPPKEAVAVVGQIAAALAAANRFGVVHRDIKPENIMITPDGTAKLVDMGVAKFPGGDSLHTITNTVFGTPAYISPEQAMDAAAVDVRADIYSLGIVFFEMLAGVSPYHTLNTAELLQEVLSPDPIPDVRDINPSIPIKLAALVQAMCAKKVEDRLPSPAALLSSLARLGYEVPSENPDDEPQTPGPEVEIDYSELSTAPEDRTLSFDTQDADVRQFVDSLKRRRRFRRIALCAVVTLVVLAALALWKLL